MSEHYWCHGPSCHTYSTQDRVRGTKGSKVLRTIKINVGGFRNGLWNYFCDQTCLMNFMHKHYQEFITLHPRTEALETPITDPKKTTHTSESRWGNRSWTTTDFKVVGVDNA